MIARSRRTVMMAVLLVLGAVLVPLLAQNPSPAAAPAAVSQPETPEHTARMAWFREAKFGLFIHWGLHAIPAGEWKGQPVAGIGEWIMNRAKIPVKEYELLAA